MSVKRPNNFERQYLVLAPIDHPEVTGTTTVKGWKCPADRKFQVTRVTYHNVTGLAEHNDNNFAGALVNDNAGDTDLVVATLFNTDANLNPDTGTNLAADTTIEGTMHATTANHWVDAGEQLLLVLTKTGTATLPAGRAIVEGYLY